MDDPEAAIATLQALRWLGIRLAIDDFGTGYSSLSYLQRFPVDTLKIHKSFLLGPRAAERDLPIVRAITSLAHALGMEVTAEGVETAAHLAQVRAVGCDRGQGYIFARQRPGEELERLLAARAGAVDARSSVPCQEGRWLSWPFSPSEAGSRHSRARIAPESARIEGVS
jgi:EAL domain-containing protein (putative c-di-GMP-specific phosphodiesterase class I)